MVLIFEFNTERDVELKDIDRWEFLATLKTQRRKKISSALKVMNFHQAWNCNFHHFCRAADYASDWRIMLFTQEISHAKKSLMRLEWFHFSLSRYMTDLHFESLRFDTLKIPSYFDFFSSIEEIYFERICLTEKNIKSKGIFQI